MTHRVSWNVIYWAVLAAVALVFAAIVPDLILLAMGAVASVFLGIWVGVLLLVDDLPAGWRR